MYIVLQIFEKWFDVKLDIRRLWANFLFCCPRNFGGRHDFDPSRDNHYTNRGIPCGEHTYPAIGAVHAHVMARALSDSPL